ncbi:MAG: helix-turn-helix transcriptional regulator [Candidatus Hodarchaeales archaeon]|jgi:hypothetical protein
MRKLITSGIIFFIIFPFFPLFSSDFTSVTWIQENKALNSLSETNVNISSANVDFVLHPNGDYHCLFTLLIVGDEHSSKTDFSGLFRVEGTNLSDFELTLSNGLINSSLFFYENFTLANFSTTTKLQAGQVYELWGYFKGTYAENNSGIYTYHLGVDWGTIVGYQETSISLDHRYHVLIQSDLSPQSIRKPIEYITVLQWINSFATGFSTDLEIILFQSSSNIFLAIIPESLLDTSLGATRVLILRNTGTFLINGWIFSPSWVTCNISSFSLPPNHQLNIGVTINSQAREGSEGSIEIVTSEFAEIITVPIHVSAKSPNIPANLFLFLILSFLIVGVVGVSYNHRATISSYLSVKKEQFSGSYSPPPNPSAIPPDDTIVNEKETTWKSITSRWKNILPENELEVLQILFFHGSMNQQAISDKMNISKMTISRIISRLEMKRLLSRKRTGMSNIIKLNEDRLF